MTVNHYIMHKKILLKLSGEFLKSDDRAVDVPKVEKLAAQIKEFIKKNIKVAIVIGAGNIMRGRSIDKTKYQNVLPDYSGMLGTVINAFMLSMVLDNLGVANRIISPFNIDPVVTPHDANQVRVEFDAGKVIILGGGTGKPGVSTDTAAMNLGVDLGVDAIYKGTLIDGVYDDDPSKNPVAVKLTQLTYAEGLEKNLKIMDKTAFELAQKHKLPVLVFKWDDESIAQLLADENVGTIIS